MKKFIFLFAFISFLIPIVSFAQAPQEAWVARYNGTANSYDEANAIAVDAEGNVYVTGESKGSSSGLDYATIKYDPDGNVIWVSRYNGPGSGDDRAYAIAVNADGNVYVTGESKGSGTALDYTTIKYDTNGNILWVARYNGPANSEDRAHGIAIDGYGNVYVTGESKGHTTNFDYATIKYDSNGNQIWAKRYNGPVDYHDSAYAIVLDSSGNVYVTGESSGSGTCLDYATIKYDTNGNEIWVRRSNGQASSHDSAYAIAVDSSGNVYVTGRSKTSTFHYDYLTIKYDTNGNELWAARYNGAANRDDLAYAIAVDSSGNVYVTGESKGSNTYKDYATIKYDTNGNIVWIARYNGPANKDDSAYAIAVDGSGNVYVTGGSIGNCPRDYATIKYDTNGNEVWVARYNGPANKDDSAYAIAVDSRGCVYVTGKSEGIGTSIDYLTIKYCELSANFSANPTSGYRPLTVQFTDESNGVITSWLWDFGDGETSTEQNPIHKYMNAGTFTVTLTVTGPGGSDTMKKTDYIHVSEVPPVAGFSANPTSGYKPLEVKFNDESTGPIDSWLWEFGDGETSTEQNPVHKYMNAGTFTVILTVTGPGGSDIMRKVDYIHVSEVPPIANFSGNPTSGNKPLTVMFNDESTGPITSWLWEFGDGGTSSEQNPSHIYTTTGTFTVTLTVTGPGGSDSEIKINYINVKECIIYVPKNYPTIQKAIDASVDGCIILVSTGTYAENINFHGKAIRVKGVGTSGPCGCPSEGSNKVTINGKYNGSVATFNTGETRKSILEGFTIKNGMAPKGGGIFIKDASPTITDCYINENSAYEIGGVGHGGGIYITGSNALPLIFNNLIVGNSAQSVGGLSHGGGIYVTNGASPIIENCTIANNISNLPGGGGIYVSSDSSPTVTNSIIWRNNPGDLYCETGCSMNVTYSDIGEGIAGTGNISKDPLFVSGTLGSYYLSHVRAGQDKDSPCIDAGSTLARNVGLDTRNTANDGITDRSKVDMGYHYIPTPIRIERVWTSKDTLTRGEAITYYITYRIEGNPETMYEVTGKVIVRGAFKKTYTKKENHYPGVYTMLLKRTIPYSAIPGNATITYKTILRQVGNIEILGKDTKKSKITVR